MKPLLLALALLAATSASAIEFVENDYTAAMARAKAKNVPVFVEAWAPW